jgi:amino acid permease
MCALCWSGQGHDTSPARRAGGAGFCDSVANLANAAIGAGVLALPDAFKLSGIVLGPLLCLFFAGSLGYSLHVLGLASDYVRERKGEAGSFQAITAGILGSRAEALANGLQLFYLTSSCIGYLIIMRDQIRPVLVYNLGDGSPWVQPWVLIPLVTWCVCFPLALIRRMSLFGIPSTLSQFGIIYTVGVVVYHSAASDFGADRAIRSGSPLVLEDCNALTRELWQPTSDARGLYALVLQTERESGAPLLCATAAGQHPMAGSSLALGFCSPSIIQRQGHSVLDATDSEYNGWDNQSFSLPIGSSGPIGVGADLCWGSAEQLALVLCNQSKGQQPGRFAGLALPNASDTGAGAKGVPLVSKDSCVAAFGTDTEEEDYGHVNQVVEKSSIFTAIPLICFSFFCHATFALVYDSLDDSSRSLRAIDCISATTMVLCTMLYITIGVAGYLFLGDDTTADVLVGINSHTGALQPDVSVARLCVAVKVACSFAMLSFVARNCIKDVLIGTSSQFSWPQFVALTVVYVGGCMLIAVVAPGVQVRVHPVYRHCMRLDNV